MMIDKLSSPSTKPPISALLLVNGVLKPRLSHSPGDAGDCPENEAESDVSITTANCG